MENASIVVIPSIWDEPFGLVAAEAMSNGACVIASKVGGLPEIIKKNGILIDKIDERKLLLQMDNVIKNYTIMKNFQQKAWKNFNLTSKKSSQRLDNYRKTIFTSLF